MPSGARVQRLAQLPTQSSQVLALSPNAGPRPPPRRPPPPPAARRVASTEFAFLEILWKPSPRGMRHAPRAAARAKTADYARPRERAARARSRCAAILFKVLGGVVDLPVGSVPLCSRGTGGRGGAGLDGLERLVVDS